MDLKNVRRVLSALIENKENAPYSDTWIEAKTYWGVNDADVSAASQELDKLIKEQEK